MSKRVNTTFIVLHHSGGSCRSSADDVIAYIKPKGLSYNYIIDRKGTIVTMTPADDIAKHAGSANSKSIGICVIGTYIENTSLYEGDMTIEQFMALYNLLKSIRAKYGPIPMLGHTDVDGCNTLCPGDLIDQYWRYVTTIPFDPVQTYISISLKDLPERMELIKWIPGLTL